MAYGLSFFNELTNLKFKNHNFKFLPQKFLFVNFIFQVIDFSRIWTCELQISRGGTLPLDSCVKYVSVDIENEREQLQPLSKLFVSRSMDLWKINCISFLRLCDKLSFPISSFADYLVFCILLQNRISNLSNFLSNQVSEPYNAMSHTLHLINFFLRERKYKLISCLYSVGKV